MAKLVKMRLKYGGRDYVIVVRKFRVPSERGMPEEGPAFTWAVTRTAPGGRRVEVDAGVIADSLELAYELAKDAIIEDAKKRLLNGVL